MQPETYRGHRIEIVAYSTDQHRTLRILEEGSGRPWWSSKHWVRKRKPELIEFAENRIDEREAGRLPPPSATRIATYTAPWEYKRMQRE